MKKGPQVAANINLKGKKSAMARCGCCVFENPTENELKKVHKKEIKEAIDEYQACCRKSL